MDNINLPAFPPNAEWEHPKVKGLTKLEIIACHTDVSDDVKDYSVSFIKEIMGEEIPEGAMDKYNYWARVEAKLKVIKAKALLSELEK